jgi:hypothetical protein
MLSVGGIDENLVFTGAGGILQILLLSLLTAWGLKTWKIRACRAGRFGSSDFLFALSPVNNQLIIRVMR